VWRIRVAAVTQLRELMEQTLRLLFDRVAGPDSPDKLANLRAPPAIQKAVGRDAQEALFHDLGKALTFIDDKLLPSTSNAVERGNRRYSQDAKNTSTERRRNRGAPGAGHVAKKPKGRASSNNPGFT